MPKPVERPVTVRAGLGALLGAYFLGVVASVAMLVRFDDVLAWTADQDMPPLETPGLELDADQLAELLLRATIVVGIVVVALQLLFVWFAWRGHNWARITLWVFAGLTLFSAPVGAAGDGGPLPFVTSLGWFETALLVVGVVLLTLSPSNDWYRYRSWQRATGQG
ncbi:hypothetical protein [Blastococcus sp. LR1]|uniref:hypothetical protein n=1 Tax=Blastococcus sp. LR1 TaxID=2877000 RepID=UPI001CCDCF64|nr:hypothetical protein [Blastococcus sp. LR1]MCA0145826.1 hypothetical protein [Blastococcus sp. LR1]